MNKQSQLSIWQRGSHRVFGAMVLATLASAPWVLAQLADPPDAAPPAAQKEEAPDPFADPRKPKAQPKPDANTDRKHNAEEEEEGISFLRFTENVETREARMETALVRYRNAEGVVVDLVGAVHIGDEAYYDDLNERFDAYDSVLFEMVGGENLSQADLAAAGNSGLSRIQTWMSRSLDLEFQLQGIDYGKANFVHADMSAAEFAAEQKENNESLMKLLLSAAQDQQLNAAGASAQPGLGDVLRILASPDMSAELKYFLGKQIVASEQALTKWGEDTVILGGRNEVALRRIDEAVARGEKNVALFYGGAHMPGVARALVEDKGFRQVEQIWLPAWDFVRPELNVPKPARETKEPAEAAK